MKAYLFDVDDVIDITLFKLKIRQWRTNCDKEFMELLQKAKFQFNDVYLGIRDLHCLEDLLDNSLSQYSLPIIKENLYCSKTNLKGEVVFSPVYGHMSPEENGINYLLRVCNSYNRENYIRLLDDVLNESDLTIDGYIAEDGIELTTKELARGFLTKHVVQKKPKDKVLYLRGFDKLIDTKKFVEELKDSDDIQKYIKYANDWYEEFGLNQSLEEFMFKDFLSECLTGLNYKKIIDVCNNEGWTYGMKESLISPERVALDFAESISRIISSAYKKIKNKNFLNGNQFIYIEDQLGRLKTHFNIYKIVDVGNFKDYEEDYFIEYNSKRYYFSFSASFIVDSFETLLT